MTHPPTAPTAPPSVALPAQSSGPPPGRPPGPPPGVAPEPPRRPAVVEGLARLRDTSRTEPGRLRLTGAVIAGLLVLFGTVTTVQTAERATTADTVVDATQPLSADAAEIYRSLADANTTAAAGFLAGARESHEVRVRYEDDIDRAGRLLSQAAAHGSGSTDAQHLIEQLSQRLPHYTGLVEAARANNRHEFPLAGAYLRYADEQMRAMLPLAEQLYELESERLRGDIDDARSRPWPALGTGVAVLLLLGWAQHRNYLRTNRVFNPGLLAATACAATLLLWLAGAHTMARGNLGEAESGGARSLSTLNEAWTEALKARGNENLVLVARGAGDEFEDLYRQHMTTMAGRGDTPGLLHQAADLADDASGRDPVLRAQAATSEWRELHADARALERSGDYNGALDLVIGVEDSTGETFDRVDEAMADAVEHEQEEFEEAADRGRDALGGLPVGAATLAVLGAICALAGIGRRLSEYR